MGCAPGTSLQLQCLLPRPAPVRSSGTNEYPIGDGPWADTWIVRGHTVRQAEFGADQKVSTLKLVLSPTQVPSGRPSDLRPVSSPGALFGSSSSMQVCFIEIYRHRVRGGSRFRV
jgi:hypothetical protein